MSLMHVRHLIAELFIVLLTPSLIACGASSQSGQSDGAPSGGQALQAPQTSEELVNAGLSTDAELDFSAHETLGLYLSKKSRTDPYNTYHPLILSNDAPVLQMDQYQNQIDELEHYDGSDVEKMLVPTMKFLVTNVADSPLMWDDSDKAWDTFNKEVDNYLNTIASSFRYNPLQGDKITRDNMEYSQYFDQYQWREKDGFKPTSVEEEQSRIEISSLTAEIFERVDQSSTEPQLCVKGFADRTITMLADQLPHFWNETSTALLETCLSFTDSDGIQLFWGTGVSSPQHVFPTISLKDGYKNLPPFRYREELPPEWISAVKDGLAYAYPPDLKEDSEECNSELHAICFTPKAKRADQNIQFVGVISFTDDYDNDAPGWGLVRNAKNYGLFVPGSIFSAAEVIPKNPYLQDTKELTQLWVYAANGKAWKIEILSNAPLSDQEVAQFAGTLSIDATD